MSISQSIRMIAVAILLSLSQLQGINAEKTSLKQSYEYPHKRVMYNDYAFKEGNLVYAVCDQSIAEKNCTVIQRQFPFEKITRSCNVTVKVGHQENVNLTNFISVHAFGNENAILFWGELGLHTTFNLMTIQLDKCKTNMLEFNDSRNSIYMQQIMSHKILTYDNDFDIFITGFDLPSVPNDIQVGIRMNVDGMTDQPTTAIKSGSGFVRYISPIATRSPAKGYVYSKMRKNAYDLLLVKPDGSQKTLKTQENYRIAVSSAIYDFITSCIQLNFSTPTTCTHFNENGDFVFSVTIDSNNSKASVPTIVHNSPRGGFLLMIAIFDQFGEQGDKSKLTGYGVVRVNGDGKIAGYISLDDFVDTRSSRTLHIWENGDEYCAASIGQVVDRHTPIIEWNDLHVVVYCFTENDFTA